MGLNAPTSIQRVNKSAGGVPANPPISSPTSEYPQIPMLNSIGVLIDKWFQVLLLSPVHVAAYRCVPEYAARVSTKGRSSGCNLRKPSYVARTFSIPYTL